MAQQPQQPQPTQQPQKSQQPTFKRKQIYINMDMQFKYSLILIFTMFVELIFVGAALLYVFSQPKPDIPGANIYAIYRMVLGIIILITLVNITVGVYMSHKVAGPLFRFVMCSREVGNGNFRIQVNLRKGDELRELETAFNEMTEKLRGVVRDDRRRLEDIKSAAETIGAEIKSAKIQEEVGVIKEAVQKIDSYFNI